METKKRTSIPQSGKIKAELQKQINSICPFCENEDVGHFEIHHIDENPANPDIDNLLLVCPTCHSKITKGDISSSDVYKKKILSVKNTTSTKSIQEKSVNFNSSVENAIVGDNNKISIKQTKGKTIQKYPEGCIGYDTNKANYISHLVKRYNEYKEIEVGKGNLGWATFGAHLKKKYKLGSTRTINNLSIEKFEELAEYIQSRIDKTKFARTQGKNHKKVTRLMHILGIKSEVRPKKYRSYKGCEGKIAPNIIERNFKAVEPNKKWTTDVTEFNLFGQKRYLSPILDMFNGEIISYTISSSPNLDLVIKMLDGAMNKRKKGKKLILHSDQGWHYQHPLYQKTLKDNEITQSMSRKGNCLDNAMMESFFGILKSEFFYLQKFESIDEFENELNKYMYYYNNDRIKSKLKGLSPVKFRTQSNY